MQHVVYAIVAIVTFLNLSGFASAQLLPPARIGGLLTIDGVQITADADTGIVVEVVRSDGTSYDPKAIDEDGLKESNNWYIIDIPIASEHQPGGATAGGDALLRVTHDGVVLTVTEPMGASLIVGQSSSSLRIDVQAASGTTQNHAPTASAGADRSVSPGTLVTLNGSASSDPDGDPLAYAWTQLSGTGVTLTGAGTVQSSFTAPAVAAGSSSVLVFQLAVSDAAGASATNQVTITVVAEAVNHAPVANAGPDQTVASQAAVTLNGATSSDPDGDPLTYQWRQTGGTTVALTGASTAAPTFTAPTVASGQSVSLAFELTVTDTNAATASDTVVITVQGTAIQNQAPIADAGPDQTVRQGDTVVLDGGNSVDPDSATNGIASYQWTQIEGISVTLQGAATSRTTFLAPAPGTDGAEALIFRLIVKDKNGAEGQDQVTINVTSGNSPPVADAGKDQILLGGRRAVLNGTASYDPDPGDAIASWFWEQIGGTLVLLTSTTIAQPEFYTPQVASNGESLVFKLTVTDKAGLKHSDQTTVNVIASSTDNAPPTANAGSDQSVREGIRVSLNGSGSSDPEGHISLYVWTQVSGQAVILSDAKNASPSFTAPAVDTKGETLVFELTVIDEGGLRSTDQVLVTITNIPVTPVANAGADLVVSGGQLVGLNGTASRDTDGWIAAYLWRQTAGNSVSLSNTGVATPSFIAPFAGASGLTLSFQLTVTDNDGLSASDDVQVTIQPGTATVPVADAGNDRIVDEGSTSILSASGSTATGGAVLVSYLWRQTAGPTVTLSDSRAMKPTFFVPAVEQGGLYLEFELTVSDSNGFQDNDTVRYEIRDFGSGPGDDGGGGCFIGTAVSR